MLHSWWWYIFLLNKNMKFFRRFCIKYKLCCCQYFTLGVIKCYSIPHYGFGNIKIMILLPKSCCMFTNNWRKRRLKMYQKGKCFKCLLEIFSIFATLNLGRWQNIFTTNSQIEISQNLTFQVVTLTLALQSLFAKECLFVECHKQSNNNNPHFDHCSNKAPIFPFFK